ncbi:MAG TPA: enoyl-CoA hydratase-related protein, partial [Rhizomicrobium sp.]
MRTDFERCYVTARGGVAVLTLNHPETVNAASFSMMQGCIKAMDLVEADSAFRALVFTGEGRGFCSGANLAEPP